MKAIAKIQWKIALAGEQPDNQGYWFLWLL